MQSHTHRSVGRPSKVTVPTPARITMPGFSTKTLYSITFLTLASELTPT